MADIPNPENDKLEIFRTPLEILPRYEWGAAKAYTINLVGMPTPVQYMLLMYTRTEPCSHDIECATILRECQRVHMEQRYLADIQWNFMIGGNGKVYEGRGWTTNATKDVENLPWDYKSIDVAYVGMGLGDITPEMKAAASKLVRRGVKEKYIKEECYDCLDDMMYRAEDYKHLPPFNPKKPPHM